MKASDLGWLTVLGAIWGMSYVFIRVAAPALGPIPLMESRFLIGGAILVSYVATSGGGRELRQELRARTREYLLLGLIVAALPTTLIGYAELRISASLAVVLNASVPFFSLVGAMVWLTEAASLRRVIGLVIGFVGVGVAVGAGAISLGWEAVPFASLSIAASAAYGLGGVLVRRAKLPSGGVRGAALTQMMAAVVLLPLLPFTVHATAASLPVLASAVLLGVFSTAIAYVIYFRLIESAGPTQAATVTYVSPAFGIVAGVLLLGEPVTSGLLLGLVLIVVGILLSSSELFVLRRLPGRPPETVPPRPEPPGAG